MVFCVKCISFTLRDFIGSVSGERFVLFAMDTVFLFVVDEIVKRCKRSLIELDANGSLSMTWFLYMNN